MRRLKAGKLQQVGGQPGQSKTQEKQESSGTEEMAQWFTCYTCRRPWFDSQHLYQEAQEICNSNSGGSNTLFWIPWALTCMIWIYIFSGTYTYRKSWFVFFFNFFKGVSSAVIPFLVRLGQIPELYTFLVKCSTSEFHLNPEINPVTINRKIPVLRYFNLKCSEWWLGTRLANLKLWIIVIVVEGCCYCNSTEFRGKKKCFAWNYIAANLSSFSSSSDGMLYFLVELLLLDSHLALFEHLFLLLLVQ